MREAALPVADNKTIPPIIADILRARGLTPDQMGAFLYPDYEKGMHDPMLLTDMDKAVKRIVLAGERGEQVVVYGDYDIDGITASAVLIEGLQAIGIPASSYIPDRFEEGYGINRAALEQIHLSGVPLVISVDCGITSVDEADWAKANGLDLIITDHHSVPAKIPDAIAVINPKRPGDKYPFKELAGVGVAFKLVQALQRAAGKPVAGQEKWLLDLVAMGSICDIVPLVGENRVLASYGLKVLRRTRRVGLRALAEVGGLDIAKIGSHEVGFVLGPRMNAAGRLEHAACSLELVMTEDLGRAHEIAAQLEELNQARRADQAAIFAAADKQAEAFAGDDVLVLADPGWSHGVVGIVASKLAEKWQKPVLLAQVLDSKIKGSARSVPGFNIVEALRAHEALLSRFGGHFFAAGYTFDAANLAALREGLNSHYAKVMSGETVEEGPEPADLTLTDLTRVEPGLMDDLAMLEPHGNGNPRPGIQLEKMEVMAVRPVGSDQKHLSLKCRDAKGRVISCIGFGLAPSHQELKAGQKTSLYGTLNNNEFQGRISIQMVLSSIDYE